MGFTDMLSSGRGPGVIGMLMALLVLVGFGALYVFVFDEELQGGNQSLESIVAEQAKEIAGQQGSLQRAEERLTLVPERERSAAELAQLERDQILRAGTLDGLAKHRDAVQEAVLEAQLAFEAYKDEYREYIRKEAVGTRMDELVTADGSIFKDVEIREIDAVGLNIRHESGFKRIAFEELSSELQDRYQFDPNQKEAALAAENAKRAEIEKAVAAAHADMDRQLVAQRQQEQVQAQENAKKAMTQKQQQISVIRREIRKLDGDRAIAERKKRSARSSGKSFIDRSGSIAGQIERLRGDIRRLEGEIQSLRQQL